MKTPQFKGCTQYKCGSNCLDRSHAERESDHDVVCNERIEPARIMRSGRVTHLKAPLRQARTSKLNFGIVVGGVARYVSKSI